MKEQVETYLTSNFIDYKGRIHPFVICAISATPPKQLVIVEPETGANEEVKRLVNIGYAVCNPDDEFNEIVGRKLAKDRALTEGKQLFSTNPGIINSTMIEGLLQQEANFIKANPGYVIKGYNDAKKKYFADQQVKKKYIVDEKSLKHAIKLLNNPALHNDLDSVIKQAFQRATR